LVDFGSEKSFPKGSKRADLCSVYPNNYNGVTFGVSYS